MMLITTMAKWPKILKSLIVMLPFRFWGRWY